MLVGKGVGVPHWFAGQKVAEGAASLVGVEVPESGVVNGVVTGVGEGTTTGAVWVSVITAGVVGRGEDWQAASNTGKMIKVAVR